MLPLLNRPIIDYVVEDCIKAGITDIYFVVSEGVQLKKYYEQDSALEQYLESKGKYDILAAIRVPGDVRFHYVHQDTEADPRYGTTVPVWLATREALVSDVDEHVVVIMGDQCLYRTDGGSEVADLITAVSASEADCGMVAVPVPRDQVSNYGIVEQDDNGNFVKIWERPSITEAPSNLNNASMYLFNREMLLRLEDAMRSPSKSGEYEIVDPINAYVASGHSLTVVTTASTYLDCGSVEKWVSANNWLLSNQYLK